MPPVPKRKVSKGRRDRRRAHDALRPPNLVPCPSCHQLRPAHQVCPHCGNYRGEKVIEIKEKKRKE